MSDATDSAKDQADDLLSAGEENPNPPLPDWGTDGKKPEDKPETE